jgi:hypothetical protein
MVESINKIVINRIITGWGASHNKPGPYSKNVPGSANSCAEHTTKALALASAMVKVKGNSGEGE